MNPQFAQYLNSSVDDLRSSLSHHNAATAENLEFLTGMLADCPPFARSKHELIARQLRKVERMISQAETAAGTAAHVADAVDWLKSTPSNDINFKNALENALLDELEEALDYRARTEGKTAFGAIRAEIHRRRKEAGDFTPLPDYDEYRTQQTHDDGQLAKIGKPLTGPIVSEALVVSTARPLELGALNTLPATPARGATLSDMSVDQLGQAFSELERAQGQYESLSGMCATLAGLVLTEVKAKVGHGKFTPWLAANFPKSKEKARLYIRIAEVFAKTGPRVRFEQLTLALLDGAQGLDGQSLDLSHPLVSQVSKWTKGRSFYQLRQEELIQGGNQHPKCPRCDGDLASKTQEICPHCGQSTGQAEPTPDDIRAQLTESTRQWALSLLSDATAEKKLYRLLPDHEAGALAAHFRALAQEIDGWVKTPERARAAMTLDEVIG